MMCHCMKLMQVFAGDTNFAQLGEGEIETQNIKPAFGCAHTIKGVAAYLGLRLILNIHRPNGGDAAGRKL